MKTEARAALVAAAFCGLGCAATRPPLIGPADGGGSWSRLTGEHVVLETDLDDAEAAEKIADFERMYDALALAMHANRAPSAQPIEVVLFAHQTDFFALAGNERTKAAYFSTQMPGDLEPRPVMVMHDAEVPEETRITFQHELAHRFIHARFATLPRWLDEGLAEYYSTVEPTPNGLVVGDVGEIDFWPRTYAAYAWHGRLQQANLPSFEAPKISDFLARRVFYAEVKEGADVSSDDRHRQSVNYVTAWRLVHYFLHEAPPEDRARFTAFLSALERGEPDAFAARFGAELPRIDASFAAFVARPTVRALVPVLVPPREAVVRHEALSDGEVHLLWSRILPRDARPDPGSAHAEFHDHDTLAVIEAEKAVMSNAASADTHYQDAVVLLRAKRYDEAAVQLEDALARRPHDPRCLYAKVALAEARRRPVDDALADELAAAATSATELQAAARLVGARRFSDGLVLAARAVAKDPLCWRCQVVRANLLARGGAFEDAVSALDRAVVLAPEGTPLDELQAVRRSWAARVK